MDFRSVAAVCQKNEGYGYLVQVKEKLGIPSSTVSRERRKNLREKKLKGVAVAKSSFTSWTKKYLNPFLFQRVCMRCE